MDSLFTTKSPEYVSASGAPLTAANHRGWFGLLPGAPEYVGASPPALPAPTTASQPQATVSPGVEVRIAVPGLLTLQGQLTIPPWLPELAPVLIPVLRSMAHSFLERALVDVAGHCETRATDDAESAAEP